MADFEAFHSRLSKADMSEMEDDALRLILKRRISGAESANEAYRQLVATMRRRAAIFGKMMVEAGAWADHAYDDARNRQPVWFLRGSKGERYGGGSLSSQSRLQYQSDSIHAIAILGPGDSLGKLVLLCEYSYHEWSYLPEFPGKDADIVNRAVCDSADGTGTDQVLREFQLDLEAAAAKYTRRDT